MGVQQSQDMGITAVIQGKNFTLISVLPKLPGKIVRQAFFSPSVFSSQQENNPGYKAEAL